MQWASYRHVAGVPLSDLLIMVPNGQLLGGDARRRAMMMQALKRRGFKNGVSDYFLAVPDFENRCAGLWIEMKRPIGGKPKLRDGQIAFADTMTRFGYQVIIAYGWMEAKSRISEYLGRVSRGNVLQADALHQPLSSRHSLPEIMHVEGPR